MVSRMRCFISFDIFALFERWSTSTKLYFETHTGGDGVEGKKNFAPISLRLNRRVERMVPTVRTVLKETKEGNWKDRDKISPQEVQLRTAKNTWRVWLILSHEAKPSSTSTAFKDEIADEYSFYRNTCKTIDTWKWEIVLEPRLANQETLNNN